MAFLEKRYEEIRFYRVILVSGRNRASAQNGYRAFAEAGYGALTGDKAGSVYQASTSYGILRGNIFIGAGIGCDYYSVTNPGYDPDYKLPEHSDGFGHFNHIK